MMMAARRPIQWTALFILAAELSACTIGYSPELDVWKKAAPQPYVKQTLDWAARAERTPAARPAPFSSFPSTSSTLAADAAPLAVPAAPSDAALAAQLAWRDLTAGVAARNPGVRAARQRWSATLAQFEQADYLETLIAQYRVFTRELNVDPGNRMNVGMNKDFYPYGGTFALKGAMARADARMARLDWEMTLRDVLIEAGNSFFEYQYLDRAIATTGDNVKLAADLAGVVENQYRSGGASQADLLKAQTELERQRNMLEDLRARRRAVRAELNAVMDRPTDAALGPAEAFDLPRHAPSEPDLVRDALQNRQEVAIQQVKVELTALALRMGEVMNRPAASQGYSSLERGMMPDASAGMPMATFGSQRKFRDDETPAFARTEAYLTEIRLKQQAETSALAQVQAQTRAMTRRWLTDLDMAQRQWRLSEKIALPQSRTAYDTARNAYSAGRTTFLDLLDAERMLIEARLELDGARRDLNQTRLREAALTGRMP